MLVVLCFWGLGLDLRGLGGWGGFCVCLWFVCFLDFNFGRVGFGGFVFWVVWFVG